MSYIYAVAICKLIAFDVIGQFDQAIASIVQELNSCYRWLKYTIWKIYAVAVNILYKESDLNLLCTNIKLDFRVRSLFCCTYFEDSYYRVLQRNLQSRRLKRREFPANSAHIVFVACQFCTPWVTRTSRGPGVITLLG